MKTVQFSSEMERRSVLKALGVGAAGFMLVPVEMGSTAWFRHPDRDAYQAVIHLYGRAQMMGGAALHTDNRAEMIRQLDRELGRLRSAWIQMWDRREAHRGIIPEDEDNWTVVDFREEVER